MTREQIGQRPTVFVVDDDHAIRCAISKSLTSRGISVKAFASADEFLSVCSEDLHGCLLIDFLMPQVDGLSLINEIRERGINLPAIIMTGNAYPDIKQKIIAIGGYGFLEKPFRIQKLLDIFQVHFPEIYPGNCSNGGAV